MRTGLFIGLLILLCTCQPQHQEKELMTNPIVTIHTTEGDITVELFADKAPITVENFLRYVKEQHYDHTIFHRVINNFMIQGGGMTADMQEKSTHAPIQNEASNGLSNKRGTIAMARSSKIHSATSQFFINSVDNLFLDYRNSTSSGYGYCVFGKVVRGMDIVDRICKMKTGLQKGHQDVPVKVVEILEIT